MIEIPLLSALAWGGVTQQDARPQYSTTVALMDGVWLLNESLSQDPREVMQQAMRQGGRGRGGAGGGRGMGGAAAARVVAAEAWAVAAAVGAEVPAVGVAGDRTAPAGLRAAGRLPSAWRSRPKRAA